MAQFGVSDADLAEGVVTPRWRAFMQFHIERNRRLYDEAMPGIGLLNQDGRFAIGAAADLYRGFWTQSNATTTITLGAVPMCRPGANCACCLASGGAADALRLTALDRVCATRRAQARGYFGPR
jgi:phytoene/squalene synthetase